MTPTTDLQKPFTDEQLKALLEQYPARPPTMGGSNVSHENSYLDHYVVSAWEKKCSAILKRREDAAPALAAVLLAERKAREVEVGELRAAAEDLVSLCSADVKMNGTTYQPMPYRSAFTKAVERLIEATKGQRDE